MLFRHHNICMDAALGSQYGALRVAAEILIAQLHSQSKLTAAWHLSNYTKKTFHEISWDYPFKIQDHGEVREPDLPER
jgi:hypothetical protein